MQLKRYLQTVALVAGLAPLSLGAQGPANAPLAGTQPLDWQGDLSARMVAGIDRFLMRELERSIDERTNLWHRDFSSRAAYEKSVEPNREHLRTIIGAVDSCVPVPALEYVNSTITSAKVAEADQYVVYAVRWPVFAGVYGEGLWLKPKTEAVADVVAIPDADQTPEMISGLALGVPSEKQFARRLAENGCEVLVLTLVDRRDTWSGTARIGRFTNQPHREWIYRQAYELGRHIIGYEVQKVLAAVDWFARGGSEGGPSAARHPKIGVAGYGEGALIGFYAAALDPRIDATVVSGYFDSRQRVWEEPIYRNVFGLLREFGDAEIASLIAPRSLIVEYSQAPDIEGPPAPQGGRRGAAPGKWTTPDFSRAEIEVKRANRLVQPLVDSFVDFVYGNEGVVMGPGSAPALRSLLAALKVPTRDLVPNGKAPVDLRQGFDPDERQHRQVTELVDHTQRLLAWCEQTRDQKFWRHINATSAADWQTAVAAWKTKFWEDVIGRFPPASLPANARTRLVYDQPSWRGYDVVLDVWPDVFAWGVLLLPKDLQPGERRPVVVCQHGLEGLPYDTITDDPNAGGLSGLPGFCGAPGRARLYCVRAP